MQKSKIIDFIDNVIGWLRREKNLVTWIVIPVLFFLADFTLRVAFQLDLWDAGADVALLAISAFVASLVEDTHPLDIWVKVALLVFFIIPWLICLALASPALPLPSAFRASSIGVGVISLVLAFLFLDRLTVASLDTL